MPSRQFPKPEPGDYLTDDLLNVLYDEINRLRLSVGNGLTMVETPAGLAISANIPQRIFIKITGVGVTLPSTLVAYPWTLQLPNPGEGRANPGVAWRLSRSRPSRFPRPPRSRSATRPRARRCS